MELGEIKMADKKKTMREIKKNPLEGSVCDNIVRLIDHYLKRREPEEVVKLLHHENDEIISWTLYALRETEVEADLSGIIPLVVHYLDDKSYEGDALASLRGMAAHGHDVSAYYPIAEKYLKHKNIRIRREAGCIFLSSVRWDKRVAEYFVSIAKALENESSFCSSRGGESAHNCAIFCRTFYRAALNGLDISPVISTLEKALYNDATIALTIYYAKNNDYAPIVALVGKADKDINSQIAEGIEHLQENFVTIAYTDTLKKVIIEKLPQYEEEVWWALEYTYFGEDVLKEAKAQGKTFKETIKSTNEQFFEAIIDGNLETLKQIVESGFSINDAVYLQYDQYECPPLYVAVDQKNTKILEYLLEKGAKVNALGHHKETALNKAVKSGTMEHLKLLLHYGADPNYDYGSGRTPLEEAYYYKKKEIVKLFLDSLGIDEEDYYTRMKQKELEVIWNLAAMGDMKLIYRIKDDGWDPNLKNENGETFLHVMVKNNGDNCKKIIYELLKRDARIDLTDNSGKTVVDYAEENGLKKIKKLLLEGPPLYPEVKIFVSLLKPWSKKADIKKALTYLKEHEDLLFAVSIKEYNVLKKAAVPDTEDLLEKIKDIIENKHAVYICDNCGRKTEIDIHSEFSYGGATPTSDNEVETEYECQSCGHKHLVYS